MYETYKASPELVKYIPMDIFFQHLYSTIESGFVSRPEEYTKVLSQK